MRPRMIGDGLVVGEALMCVACDLFRLEARCRFPPSSTTSIPLRLTTYNDDLLTHRPRLFLGEAIFVRTVLAN